MHCYGCGRTSEGNGYCSHCGSPLELKEFIVTTVKSSLADVIKDRDILETESGQRVFEKAWEILKLHGKIFLLAVTVSIAILGSVIVWRGYDLNNAVAKAEAYIDEKTNTFKTDFDAAHSQLEEANQLKPSVDELEKKVAQTAADLETEKQALSSKEDLIKVIFQSHIVEVVKTTRNPDNSKFLLVPPPSGGKRSIVFLLTSEAPIENTLQVQAGFFNKNINPPSWHNVIMIPTEDKLDDLRNDVEFTLSYFADRNKNNIVHSLSLKDGRPYADDTPLPYFDEKNLEHWIVPDALDSDNSSAPPQEKPAAPKQ